MDSDLIDATRKAWGFSQSGDSPEWEHAGKTEAEAREYAEEQGGGFIAEGFYPDPGLVAAEVADITELMERMDEHATDNAFYSDEPLFTYRAGSNEPHAENDLREVLRAWADRHLKATQFTVSDKRIRVEAAPDDDATGAK